MSEEKYSDSYTYDIDITGTIQKVIFDLGPTYYVYVISDDGILVRFGDDLPCPDDENFEDFWEALVGQRIHVKEHHSMEVKIL